MAFENNNGLSAADMAAVMRGGNNGGFGMDGFGAWWIVLFMLFAFMGNGNWGNGGYGNGGGAPYVVADVQRGFDQSATINAISNLSTQVGSGFADAAVARCAGDANITAAVTNSQFGVTQAIGGAKDTLANGMNQLAMSLQNCCCENRAGLADLKYTVATENCADRQALSDGLRDLMAQNVANTNAIIQSNNAGFQAVQDKLCQLELDSYKQKVSDQAAEIASLRGQVSQTAQTAAIIADNQAQTANLLANLNPPARPAYIVQNPNCCAQNYGCGCA